MHGAAVTCVSGLEAVVLNVVYGDAERLPRLLLSLPALESLSVGTLCASAPYAPAAARAFWWRPRAP